MNMKIERRGLEINVEVHCLVEKRKELAKAL
jgi:hypothetical protein